MRVIAWVLLALSGLWMGGCDSSRGAALPHPSAVASSAAEPAGSARGRDAIFEADHWVLGQGEASGKRFLTRYRDALAPFAGDDRFPTRVEIAAAFAVPGADGMPGSADLDALERLEDGLIAAFDAKREGLLVGATTTNGARTFVVYAKPGDVEAVVAGLGKAVPQKLRTTVEADPGWKWFKEMAAAMH